MRFERGPQGGGESDECTCAQCRGVDLPDWLHRLDERHEEARDSAPG